MWFKVDDRLHAHLKARRLRKSHPSKRRDAAPFGLWVLAGSWVGQHQTEGFVPLEILEEWDDDAEGLAERLVSVGFWEKTDRDGDPGYVFHDHADYLPQPKGVADASEAGIRGNHIRWHVESGVISPDCPLCVGPSQDDRGDSGATRGDDRGDVGRVGSAIAIPEPDPDPNPTLSPAAAADADFATWWVKYPKKEDKGHARTQYRAAHKKVGPEVLLDGLDASVDQWQREGRDRKFTPNPATWLRGERWADAAPPPTNPQALLPRVDQIESPPPGLSDEEEYRWQVEQAKKLRGTQ